MTQDDRHVKGRGTRFFQGLLLTLAVTVITAVAIAWCTSAHAQYLDHRTCADGFGWAVNAASEEKANRYYSVIDANGECDWHYLNAHNRSHSYAQVGPTQHVKSAVTIANVMYFVRGDGTCYMASTNTVATVCAGAPTTPPVIIPPPAPPPPVNAKHYKVAVVILRWQSPPAGAGAPTIAAFNASLPNVTTANVQAAMDQVSAWYTKETYGRMILDVKVFPSVDLPGNPACGYPFKEMNDVLAGQQFDQYIIAQTYTCWMYHGATFPGQIDAFPGYAFVHHLYAYEPGTIAHELGHGFGLWHAGWMIPPQTVVTEYGNSVDQMGRGGSYAGLAHFLAPHKNKLKSLTPGACVSATLRSIYLAPDALLCGTFYVEYLDDWSEVRITKITNVSGSGGGDDNYTVARLKAGQSWTDGTTTVKHIAGGQVVVTP